MLRIILISLAATLLMLCISSCKPDTVPYQTYCSIQGDGTLFDKEDNSLRISSFGRAFYLTDSQVLYLGESLVLRDLRTGLTEYLSPNNLIITDERYLAIDKLNALIYFAANHDIYRVGFNGQNLAQISPSGSGSYSAPSLSGLGYYLTAIKDGHIMRYDTQTGEWLQLATPTTASYAVFLEDSEEYYFYSVCEDGYYSDVSLCRTNGAESDSTMLLNRRYPEFDNTWLNLRVSKDHRWFGLHSKRDPRENIDWFGGSSWERFPTDLMVYDRISDNTSCIPDCYSYAFVLDADELMYSHYQKGMADFRKMDLNSGLSTLIWDGYYCPGNYFFSISEIFPRADGQKIYLSPWVKALM